MDPFVERDKSRKSKSGPYTGPLLLLRSDWWCGFLSSWDAAGIHPGIKPSEAVKPALSNSEERSGIRVFNTRRSAAGHFLDRYAFMEQGGDLVDIPVPGRLRWRAKDRYCGLCFEHWRLVDQTFLRCCSRWSRLGGDSSDIPLTPNPALYM